MNRGVVALTVIAVAPACGHWDLGDRAPAHVDVRRPPADLAGRTVEHGIDPGENWVVVRAGPLLGGALNVNQRSMGSSLGLELSVTGDALPETHTHPPAFDFFGQGRGRELAVNLGLVHTTWDAQKATSLYCELQARDWFFTGAAGGWNWEPKNGRHGPQITGFVGPFYLRFLHYLGQEITIGFGVIVKGESGWVWSR